MQHASCCQKGAGGWGYNPKPSCTSGVRKPRPAPGGKSDTLRMLASDTSIEVRVFVDTTFIEAYWMDGRVAMTSKLAGTPKEAGMSVFNAAGAAVTVQSVQVWRVNSIYVSPEDVLRTPRMDGKH